MEALRGRSQKLDIVEEGKTEREEKWKKEEMRWKGKAFVEGNKVRLEVNVNRF